MNKELNPLHTAVQIEEKLEQVQSIVGYHFEDSRLLLEALVHRSYLNDKDKNPTIKNHNERLEFLGDAVLELIVTDYLYEKMGVSEGVMTSLRSSVVNYKLLGSVGNNLGLDDLILLSKGEREELGKARLTIVADCMEAIIGAIYKDGGIQPCINFIHQFVLIHLPDILANKLYKDSKTLIQEFCQKHVKITPHYRVLHTEGKDHEKTFIIGVWIGAEKLSEGQGRSKQDAEAEAAKYGLKVLEMRYPLSTHE
ncbi:MAG: ribonuclease III [candidate division SR1 bacterium]|nr:ribonuclease III [candidate division SR1 bacterium]